MRGKIIYFGSDFSFFRCCYVTYHLLHLHQFPGHLAFQCRNYLVLDPNRRPILADNVETSSSEEEEFQSPVRQNYSLQKIFSIFAIFDAHFVLYSKLQKLNQLEKEQALKDKALRARREEERKKRRKKKSRTSSSSSSSRYTLCWITLFKSLNFLCSYILVLHRLHHQTGNIWTLILLIELLVLNSTISFIFQFIIRFLFVIFEFIIIRRETEEEEIQKSEIIEIETFQETKQQLQEEKSKPTIIFGPIIIKMSTFWQITNFPNFIIAKSMSNKLGKRRFE